VAKRGSKGSSRKRRKAAEETGEPKLYTLTEISEATGISMPTLLRYKKNFQDRIPSVGKGRTQRYPKAALEVVQQIKKENLQKRGGARRGSEARERGYLPLTEIAERAEISYPTARKYAAEHASELDTIGAGRRRRYAPATAELFKKIRAESRRGGGRRSVRVARSGRVRDPVLARRIKELERAQAEISRQLHAIIQTLKRPLQVTIEPR
jgi:DNA-binding transcriptional MerR regulator